MKFKFLNATLASSILSISSLVSVANAGLITNGDFSTGDFTGWDVGITPTVADGGRPYSIDTSGDGWDIRGTTLYATNGFDGGAILNGVPDYEADLDFYLQQDFSFSGNVISAFLSFEFDITGGPSFVASRSGAPTEDRVFDVSFLDSLGIDLGSVYTYTVAGTTVDSNPRQFINLDVTSFFNNNSGNNFKLSFNENIPQYFTGGGSFQIDNIDLNIVTADVPEPSTLAIFALGMMGLASRRFKKQS